MHANVTKSIQSFVWFSQASHNKATIKFQRTYLSSRTIITSLTYLAAGESYPSLNFSFRVEKSAVLCIVPETCEVIYAALAPMYRKPPNCLNNWLKISQQLENEWNLSYVIGVIYIKHTHSIWQL